MSKNHIYKITVLNWIEHNPGTKKHFKKTLIANNLTSDAKINALPLSCKWLFINLLLICGDYAKDTVTLTERQVNDILTTKEGPQNALDRLASFQLVTFEKNDFLRIEKKEKKRIEIKEVKELSSPSDSSVEIQKPKRSSANISDKENFFLIRYCELFKDRYGTNPVIDGKSTGFAKSYNKTFSKEKSEKYLQAFFKLPDALLVKAKHPLNLFSMKLNEITVFAESGNFTTQTQARNLDQSATTADMIQQIREGKL